MKGGVSQEFVLELVACQNKLRVYALSLLVDKQQANDVVQQANVVLLQKADQYEPGTNFTAWACRTVYYEVLAARRRQNRDKLVFDDSILDVLAADAERQLDEVDRRATALDECLKQLSSDQRRTLIERYSPGGSVKAMAAQRQRSPNSISMTLHRLRTALEECVRNRLEAAQDA